MRIFRINCDIELNPKQIFFMGLVLLAMVGIAGATNSVIINSTSANINLNSVRLTSNNSWTLGYIHTTSDGVVECLDMEATTGTTIQNCNNVNGTQNTTYTGTWYGNISINTTTGKIGNAVSFDGINDYIQVQNGIIDNQQNWTIITWVKRNVTTSSQSAWSFWNSTTTGTASNNSISLLSASTQNTLYVYNMTGILTYVYSSGIQFPVSGWTMQTFVYNGTHIIHYINETNVGNTMFNFSSFSQFDNFTVAAKKATGITGYLNGSIDEVKIVNRALSASEIATEYNTSMVSVGNISIVNQTPTIGYMINNMSVSYLGQDSINNASIYIKSNTSLSWSILSSNTTSNTWFRTFGGGRNNTDINISLNGNGSNTPFVSSLTYTETTRKPFTKMMYVPYNYMDTQAEVNATILNLSYMGVDAIMFQVMSDYLETERNGYSWNWNTQASWDMLNYSINAAHASNMQLYVWIPINYVSNQYRAEDRLFGNTSRVVLRNVTANPNTYSNHSTRNDLANTTIFNYEIDLLSWVAQNYSNLDGIHIEEPGYPAISYNIDMRNRVLSTYGYDPVTVDENATVRANIESEMRLVENEFFTALRTAIDTNKSNPNLLLSADKWSYTYELTEGFDTQYMDINYLIDWYACQCYSTNRSFFQDFFTDGYRNYVPNIPILSIVGITWTSIYPSTNSELYNEFVDLNSSEIDMAGIFSYSWKDLIISNKTAQNVLHGCVYCLNNNITLYVNGTLSIYVDMFQNESNMSIVFNQYGSNDTYTFNITTDTTTSRIFNESSNNASLQVQIIQSGLTPSTNFNINRYNSTSLNSSTIGSSNSTGVLQYTVSDFSGTGLYTIITLTYNISGFVNDSIGSMISSVSVVNGTNSTTTNATGYYSILMSNGTYNFTYSKAGYITNYKEIIIDGADVVNQNVTLVPEAAEAQFTRIEFFGEWE